MSGHRRSMTRTGAPARLLLVFMLVAAGVVAAPPSASAADRTLTGTVLGADGYPVAGAGVSACSGTAVTNPCDGNILDTDLAANGTYSLSLPEGGEYAVVAYVFTASGLQTSPVHQVGSADPGGSHNFTLPVAFGLPATRPLSGSVVNQDGIPVPGAGAVLCPGVSWTAGCVGSRTAFASGNGSFSILIHPDTEYRILPFAYQGAVSGQVSSVAAGTAPVVLTSPLVVDTSDVRAITGRILGPSGSPIASGNPQATAVWLCPAANGSTGGCKDRRTVFTAADGTFTAYVRDSVDYNLQAVSYALLPLSEYPGGVRSYPLELPAATGDRAVGDITLAYGELRGTVDRFGWDAFPQNTIGVGACPTTSPTGGAVPNTGTAEKCFGLQAVFARADGSYRMPLPPGTYNVSGYMFVDGVLVIGPARSYTVQPTVLQDAQDFLADPPGALFSTGTALVLPAPSPDLGTITVSAGGRPIANAVAIAPGSFANDPAPEAAWGALTFTVATIPGETIEVTLDFERPIPAGATFHKLVPGTTPGALPTWQPFSGFRRLDDYTATLTLTDGGAGDYDGVPNGFITDPLHVQVDGADFALTGFARPLAPYPTPARIKAGSAIPAKWRVTDVAGAPVEAGGSPESLTLSVTCGMTTTQVSLDPSGVSSLGDGWWQADIRTSKSWRDCRGSLVLKLFDESSITGVVSFR